MGKVRYIGSKARLASQIAQVLGAPKTQKRFVDLFAGTGAVSRSAADAGWKIHANDSLGAASILTSARLMAPSEIPFKGLGGYKAVISHLNQLEPVEGFFFREYSPSGLNREKTPRPYFSEQNARIIDAIRTEISILRCSSQITKKEHVLLLADLMEASNQVANIAGTYGCFMKNLTASSCRPLILSMREMSPKKISWKVTTDDVFDVETNRSDVVYLDPPYTKRQYSAYYHILETIAHEDEPDVVGITGLRPWESKASLFCYKTKAASAMERLISQIAAKRILVSYSSEGHISFDQLSQIMAMRGQFTVYEFPHFGRYSPNKDSRKNSNSINLIEYLFDLKAN